MYNSAEQQGDEEVGQLTGGQIDTRDLKTPETRKKKEEQHTTVTDAETQHEHQQSSSGWKINLFQEFFACLMGMLIPL